MQSPKQLTRTDSLAAPRRAQSSFAEAPVANTTDMLSGLHLENAILHNAVKKTSNPMDKMFFLGFLAGIWVGLGGMAALSAGGGIPVEVRDAWPVLPKLGVAVFFPFALHMILLFGGELFTGNTMILTVGLLNRVVSPKRALLNLLMVYIGNWCGCLTVAYFFGYRTEIFAHEPYLSFVRSLTISKIEGHRWGVLFLKAIPANTLVCMAVMLGIAARDSAGKIMALHFPIVLFVISGFEHCVANMFFVSLGLLYGAPSTITRLWFNQSAAVVGNFVGGALVIACSEHAMNHWQSPIPAVFNEGYLKEDGSLAAHDVESTRRAQDYADHRDAAEGKSEMRKMIRERRPSVRRSTLTSIKELPLARARTEP